jgi:hypothetical protein
VDEDTSPMVVDSNHYAEACGRSMSEGLQSIKHIEISHKARFTENRRRSGNNIDLRIGLTILRTFITFSMLKPSANSSRQEEVSVYHTL